MAKEIIRNTDNLFNNYPQLIKGRKVSISDYKNLKRKVKRKIPKWYVQLMIDFPISDLEIRGGFQFWLVVSHKQKKNY